MLYMLYILSRCSVLTIVVIWGHSQVSYISHDPDEPLDEADGLGEPLGHPDELASRRQHCNDSRRHVVEYTKTWGRTRTHLVKHDRDVQSNHLFPIYTYIYTHIFNIFI